MTFFFKCYYFFTDFFLLTTTLMDAGIHAPSFLQEPSPNLIFSNDTGAQMSCSAHGNPVPTITWILKDGNIVNAVSGLR